MKFKSAKFIKGTMGDDDLLRDGKMQVAFIGRSNVGKSSVINSLAGMTLARSSDLPGKTKEINLYLMKKDLYFVDLPGYGYARASHEERDNLRKLIYWYLLFSDIKHKIVMIVDANVGLTEDDINILRRLTERQKDLIIVANKIDKIKKSESAKKYMSIREKIGDNRLILYSAKEKIGVTELLEAVTK